MSDLPAIVVYVLSCMGLTILLVWPSTGPAAWIRDRIMRRVLPESVRTVLDCYICLSVWVALAAAPWWWIEGFRWVCVGWLMVPAVFWLVLPESRSGD